MLQTDVVSSSDTLWTTEDLGEGAVEFHGALWLEVLPRTWIAERYGYTGPVQVYSTYVVDDPDGTWPEWQGGLWIPCAGHEHAQDGYVRLAPGAYRIERQGRRWVTAKMPLLTPKDIEAWAKWMVTRRGQGDAYLRNSLTYEMVPEILQ